MLSKVLFSEAQTPGAPPASKSPTQLVSFSWVFKIATTSYNSEVRSAVRVIFVASKSSPKEPVSYTHLRAHET